MPHLKGQGSPQLLVAAKAVQGFAGPCRPHQALCWQVPQHTQQQLVTELRQRSKACRYPQLLPLANTKTVGEEAAHMAWRVQAPHRAFECRGLRQSRSFPTALHHWDAQQPQSFCLRLQVWLSSSTLLL